MGTISLGKGYHTTQKVFAPEDPFAQFLLKWIVLYREVGLDVTTICEGRGNDDSFQTYQE